MNLLRLIRCRYYSSSTAQSLQDLSEIAPSNIRNFCIIAHVDHGKSTLADRLLQLTGCISKEQARQGQVLDTLPVERARGITVKAQTASMLFNFNNQPYLLNLVDTPGHADFGWEVQRSMAACQGALLVVDATQGIQAQTVANYWKARDAGITAVVPVINKIDLPTADVEGSRAAVEELVGRECRLAVSAKSGLGCEAVLEEIVGKIPAPTVVEQSQPLRALIVDSWFDEYRGVVCLVSVKDGVMSSGSQLSMASGIQFNAIEVGHMTPAMRPASRLPSGHVGYLVTGLKSIRDIMIGDTIFDRNSEAKVDALPGFPTKLQPTVFAGIFPSDSAHLPGLRKALDKLLLNDPSVAAQPAHSALLGAGFRLGFLGSLHMEVFKERLEGEFRQPCLITNPTVSYTLKLKDGSCRILTSPEDFPDGPDMQSLLEVLEPVVKCTIVIPIAIFGDTMSMLTSKRGTVIDQEYLEGDRLRLTSTLPLAEIVTDFHDRLQSLSAGYASYDYADGGWQSADIVKVRILVNGEPVDVLSSLQHRSASTHFARSTLAKLRPLIDRQQFEVALQAAINSKIIARETVSAVRKDVTGKCYGGDGTRQKKLLEKQREGKEKLKRIGRVELRPEAFAEMVRMK